MGQDFKGYLRYLCKLSELKRKVSKDISFDVLFSGDDMAIKIFLDRLDTVVSILGLVLGLIIMALYLISPTVQLLSLGGALFCASLLYLILIPKMATDQNTFNLGNSNEILGSVFYLLFAMSMLVFYSSESRTLLYFILISSCAGLIAILCLNVTTKRDVIVQIFNIVLLSLNIKLTKFYFYGGSGVDYWTHLKMNGLLSQIGNIGVLFDKEMSFPMMHINVAITQILSNVGIKDASMYSITIPLIISSVCVYFVARELFNEKIGLLGMLIVNVTDYHAWWGSAPQTTSYGVILFFFVIYLLYKFLKSERRKMYFVILFVFLFTLISAHAVSSFILLMTIFGLFVGSVLYAHLYDRNKKFIPLTILLVYAILLIHQWLIAIYSDISELSFFDVIVRTLDLYLGEYASFLNRPEAVAEYAALLPPLYERLINSMGLSILIFMAIIGSLIWLSSRHRMIETFSIIICVVILLGITFGFPLFGIRNIIPHRWFAFEYFFLSIMAAFSAYYLFYRTNSKQRIYILMILFSCLSFFMLTSTSNNLTNLDSPLWLQETSISTSYTFQEVYGAETLTHHSGSVFSDSRYGTSVIGVNCGLQHSSFDSEDLSKRIGSIFIWRDYMKERPIQMFTIIDGYYKPVESDVVLGEDYLRYLDRFQKVYKNDDIVGYFII